MSDEEPENEWDQIVCLPIIDVSKGQRNGAEFGTTKNDFNESEELVTTKQLIDHIKLVNPDQKNLPPPSISLVVRIFRYLAFWQRKPDDNQKTETSRIIELSTRPFENGNKFHLRCLYTVFAKLTGNLMGGFRRFGPHWEQIGFQGSDPATDFRGVGILGLFQLTFFAVTPTVAEQCREIYEFSTDSIQHYPFAVTSMNLTQLALQMLRNGSLNQFANRSRTILDAFNQFYFGTFLAFHEIWKRDGKTIMDIGYVLKDLKTYARNNPKKIIDRVTQIQKIDADRTANGTLNFTNIMVHGDREEEEE